MESTNGNLLKVVSRCVGNQETERRSAPTSCHGVISPVGRGGTNQVSSALATDETTFLLRNMVKSQRSSKLISSTSGPSA